MNRFLRLILLFLVLSGVGFQTSRAQMMIENTVVDTQTIITGLDTPWEMVWGPDDHLWITERFGRISRIDPLTGEQHVILNISDEVEQTGESGMLGLALHPDFPEDSRVYVVYTYLRENVILERLAVYRYKNGALTNGQVLIDSIPGNATHNGSRLLFDTDKTLLMTTGDAQNLPSAQDINSLTGKVLRINDDGTVPDDNPYPGSYVYSVGHRNAQGLCRGPNGWIVSSEHGPSNDDELNIIRPAANYGWPEVEGYCDQVSEQTACEELDVTEPVLAWTPTLAVSDVEYYQSDVIPELEGALLMVTLKEKDMRALFLSEDGMTVEREVIYFDHEWNRLRALCIAPDGSIYISNSRSNWGNSTSFDHQIVRIYNSKLQGDIASPNTPSIRAYPNPFRKGFYIEAPSYLEDAKYSVSSISGEQLFSGTRREVMDFLNSKRVQSGIYFLNANTELGAWQRRLVKTEN